MAAPLETCTREEQRSVIRFLRSESLKPIEIHRRLKVQYGNACYWGRNLGSLPPTGNEESEQGMASFLITKTKEVSNRTISREGYADSHFGRKRRHFGALHA
jgi:hypothetical protein